MAIERKQKRFELNTTTGIIDESIEAYESVSTNPSVNTETLTGNKALTIADKQIQIYDVDGAFRTVTLPITGMSEGDRFTIFNDSAWDSSYNITIYKNAEDEIQRLTVNSYADYVYTGSKWQALFNGGFTTNNGNYGSLSTGYLASAYSFGTAYGSLSLAYMYGATFGYGTVAPNKAVAFGVNAYSGHGENTASLNAGAKVQRVKEITWTHTDSTNTNKSNTSIIGIKEKSYANQTAFIEVFLDALSGRVILLANSSINYTLKYHAIRDDGNESKAWKIEGAIRNDNDVVSLVGSPIKTVIGETSGATTWDIQVSADDTNDCIKLEFKGDANTIIAGGSFFLHDLRI